LAFASSYVSGISCSWPLAARCWLLVSGIWLLEIADRLISDKKYPQNNDALIFKKPGARSKKPEALSRSRELKKNNV
jgi:hypothetical protein